MSAPASEMTADEMFESLTGFDEIGITKQFGKTITDLAKTDELQMVRALVFTDQRRAGLKDSEAFKAAQTFTLGEIDGYFTEDDEIDPEDPVTDSGKGEPSSELEPTS